LRPLESLGIERMKETAPTEAVGCTIDGGQEAKTEILVYISRLDNRWRYRIKRAAPLSPAGDGDSRGKKELAGSKTMVAGIY
jgi:hypothetical protein